MKLSRNILNLRLGWTEIQTEDDCSALTRPRVEKLSWNRNDKISTRSIPLDCRGQRMTHEKNTLN